MTITDIEIIQAKALGILNGIKEMSKEERTAFPSGAAGEDYNQLRSSTIRAFPELEQAMPPRVEIAASQSGSEYADHQYTELLVFVSQIYELVRTRG